MLTTIRLIKALCVIAFLSHCANSYNLSPKPNAVMKDPQLPTYIPKYESSYFGFSLNLRPKG